MGFGAKEWHGENSLFMKSVLYMENTLEAGWPNWRFGDRRQTYDVNLMRGEREEESKKVNGWGEGWKGWESKRRVMYPIFTWALQSYRLNIICLLWTRSWPPPKFIHWSSNPNVMVIFGFSVFSRHHSHLGGLLKTNCWASFTLRVSDLVSFKVGPEICISNKVFRRCWWCWARALLWEPLSCNIVSACWVSHYPSPEILHQTPHLDSYFYSHSA